MARHLRKALREFATPGGTPVPLTSTDRVRIARCDLIAAILRHPDLTDYARLRYLREHEERRQGLPVLVQTQLVRNLP